ncbi:MAG TPA: DUF885 domain-containing protein [Blastocatellia bacterium]|nr:DUF885 domain-containing protein [Blastocatellia bacterium]
MIRNAGVVILILSLTGMALGQVASSSMSKRLHAIFEEDWQWGLEQFPEMATLLGDNRYNNRLTDYSPVRIELRKAHHRTMLNRIKKIDRSKLSGQDVISYDLFVLDKELNVEGERWPAELMPLNQMDGVHLSFPQLAGSTPFRTSKDYDDYLARLAAYPRQIDQVIALMKRGIEKNWVLPAVPLNGLPSQIRGQIVGEPEKSPLYQPFTTFPAEVSAAEQTRLAGQGRQRIASGVLPALNKLLEFIEQTYLPQCRQDIAAKALPDGEAYYAYQVRRLTTTGLTPRQIHDTGVAEIARIRNEMEAIIKQVGFKGSFQDFITFLRTDKRFYFSRPEDLVMAYRDISKRADAELPELFAELPRNPYGVREIPEYEAPAQTTAYYQPGAADGSRCGWYWVNTWKLETRPKYEMEALSLHEAVPGHHLQISRAQELEGLPDFRRNGGYTAYIEGWGLYAESLGGEMGFYKDPYSKFGQLTYEMWRACRLVVDTGMHSFGWSRQQAIELMKENTAKTENDIIVEIDRYIVWPGQALAYKIGELKIKELKARAKRELGERFDIRKFHNALLDDGPLPLDLLEKQIDAWIARQQRKK